MNHDHSYKLLFSHAEMVADLLRGFVREDWVKQLDFSTLEKVSGSFMSVMIYGSGKTTSSGAYVGEKTGCTSTCCSNSSRP
jgi:hypothetical protein